eukprot:1374205-Ditylum_brightwellii.AAC.1
MKTFKETTRAAFNKRVDLQNQGTQLLCAMYQKYMPQYNPLTPQQIVNNFTMLKSQNRKNFSSSEVKNIFILGLGKLFEPVINRHLDNNLPTEWHTTDLHKLSIVEEKFKKQQDAKKKLFELSSASTSKTESHT